MSHKSDVPGQSDLYTVYMLEGIPLAENVPVIGKCGCDTTLVAILSQEANG